MMKAMDSIRGKAQTTAMPEGIARICNAAIGSKTRFHVSKSLGRSSRGGPGVGRQGSAGDVSVRYLAIKEVR